MELNELINQTRQATEQLKVAVAEYTSLAQGTIGINANLVGEVAKAQKKLTELDDRLTAVTEKEKELAYREAQVEQNEDIAAAKVALAKRQTMLDIKEKNNQTQTEKRRQELDEYEARLSVKEKELVSREKQQKERETNYRAEIEQEIINKLDKA